MKNKWLQLLSLLTGIFLLLGCFWIVMDMPNLTAEGAFFKAERRQILKESTFLEAFYLANVGYSGKDVMNGSIFVHTGVGKTETALHTTELCRKMPSPLWYNEEEMVVIPLTGDLTAEWNPWCAEWQRIGVLVYSPLVFDHGCVTVTVGRFGFTQELDATETGLMIVEFPDLSDDPIFDQIRQQIQWRQYDLRSIGYDESQKTIDVTLKVILYDSANVEIARVVKDYPAAK